MTGKQTKQIIRIALILGTVISLFFVPWPILFAWLPPLPDTVQEQVDETIDHGFDGIIVYVDESGQPPAFYAAGWHDRKRKYLPTRTPCSKLPVSASYMLLLPSPNWSRTTACLWIKRSLITFLNF